MGEVKTYFAELYVILCNEVTIQTIVQWVISQAFMTMTKQNAILSAYLGCKKTAEVSKKPSCSLIVYLT